MPLFASFASLLLPILSTGTEPVTTLPNALTPTANAQDPAKPKPAREGEKPKPGQNGEKPGDKPKSEGEDGKDKGKDKDKGAEKEEAASGHATWGHDHTEALAAAKAAKKPVLMLFTGSDWCPPCKKLHSEVFESEAFAKWAEKNVVLLELDFPRRKEIPKEQKEHNAKLQKEFSVSGFPTVVFLDAKGTKLFDQVGFGGGTAEKWIEKVEKELKKK